MCLAARWVFVSLLMYFYSQWHCQSSWSSFKHVCNSFHAQLTAGNPSLLHFPLWTVVIQILLPVPRPYTAFSLPLLFLLLLIFLTLFPFYFPEG